MRLCSPGRSVLPLLLFKIDVADLAHLGADRSVKGKGARPGVQAEHVHALLSAKHTHVDPRQANALANVVKSYTSVIDSLKAGRGARSSKQTIVVKKSVSIHDDNRSVTLQARGRPKRRS